MPVLKGGAAVVLFDLETHAGLEAGEIPLVEGELIDPFVVRLDASRPLQLLSSP